jgi:tripartite-type tricarboxylate transporter receptor subunit TctC
MITLIVPFAAGGPTDVLARIVAESMSRTLGQQIVIENVVGAGGTTAGTRAMRALPDGYTLILGNMGTHGAAAALYPKLAYNPSTDFAPVGMVAGAPILLVGKKDTPARDLGEFISYAKEHAAGLTMAHAGMGSVSQVTCQLFNSILGLSPKQAAYQGSGPAMTALKAGEVDYMCCQAITVVPEAKADSIRIYTVATPARSQALPEIPTSQEAGLQEFEVSAWNAIFAPRHTPQPIIARLNAALVIALEDEEVSKRLLELGNDIPLSLGRSPQALAAVVKKDIAKWSAILGPARQAE